MVLLGHIKQRSNTFVLMYCINAFSKFYLPLGKRSSFTSSTFGYRNEIPIILIMVFDTHVGWLMKRKNEHVIREGSKIDWLDLLDDWVVVLNKFLW